MPNEGPTTTGSINAKIGATITELQEKVAEAKALTKDLTDTPTNIKVGADVSEAITKLSAVEAAERKLGLATDNLKLSYQRLDEIQSSGTAKQSTLMAAHLAAARAENAHADAVRGLARAQAEEAAASTAEAAASDEATNAFSGMRGGTVALGGAVIGLAAAIGPLTAFAVAAAGGLAGLGAAGVLAFEGIKKSMKDGSKVGDLYSASLIQLKGDLGQLETTAASAFLGSFQSIEQRITADMPQLNSEIAHFTAILGDAAATAVPAIIDALKQMNPLFVEGANLVDDIAHSFSDWVSSGGLKEFVAYAEKELPVVEQALVAISKAAVALGTSLSSSGNAILKVATTVADLIQLTSSYTQALDKLERSTRTGNTATDGLTKGLIDSITPMADLNHVLDALNTGLGYLTGSTQAAQDAQLRHIQAIHVEHDAATVLAAQYGTSVSVYQSVTSAQKATANQLAAATLQMQLQNDAAGILKQTLDILDGKTLGVAEAQTSMAAANNAMTDSFKQNGLAIDGNSKAAVANQQAIQQSIDASHQYAEAIGKQTGSSEQARQALINSKQALEDNLKKYGELTPAVQGYINQIFQIPASVPPTKFDADTTAAQQKLDQLQKQIDSLAEGFTLKFQTNKDGSVSVVGKTAVGGGRLTASAYASGGTIGGPSGTVYGAGSSTSDSILARLSVGEEVTNASSANYPGVRPLLKSINYDAPGTMAALSARPAPQKTTVNNWYITNTVDPAQVAAEVQRRVNMRAA